MLVHGREGGEIKNRSRYMLAVSSPSSTSEIGVSTNGSSISCYIKDGRKISVGECALFKPAQDSPPFVGIIRSFTSGKESNITVCVNWLYRPAEVKLLKGVALEAEPNEVFYSFHRDEIRAASLLHPCKVAFLSRGAELPAGVSSFVCRRVYDFTNKCLWWLADQDFIDERQVEVDKLLRKTHIGMHAPIKHPQGPRSPRLLNGSAADGVQNSSSNLSSQTKGKKRDRRGQSFEPNKRERNGHPDDDDYGQMRSKSLLSLEIGKIAGKGGLTDSDSVANLVCLLKLEKSQRKLDFTGRSILAGIIAATEKHDYLSQFVQLKGLAVFDDWLQEVHKGKIGDSGNLKDSDKSLEDFLLVMLGALDKLPVDLNALQTCNIGKSVNHLRSHKNSEIQRKARSLVDTWKKRVEAEMSNDDAKSGFTQTLQWPGRSKGGIGGYKHSGVSSEAVIRRPGTRHSSLKSGTVKLAQEKSNLISGSAYKSNTPVSTASNCKDERSTISANRGISEPIQAVAWKENGSCSSQSHTNNLCSSEYVKSTDAKKSTADSRTLNKTIGSDSKHWRSANTRISDVHKETASNSSSLPENVSPKAIDGSVNVGNIHEGNNHKLIVKIPNRIAQSIVAAAAHDSSCKNSGASSPVLVERHAQLDARLSEKHLSLQSSEVDDTLAAEHQMPIDIGRLSKGSKTAHSPVNNETNLVKTFYSTYSPLDALIESCAIFSEANISILPGDDVGIHLLASVAIGEFSEPNIVSTAALRPSTTAENLITNCNGNEKQLHGIDVIQEEGLSAGVGTADECKISSGVSNVNSGESTQHQGTAIGNLLQEGGCLGDNMISDEHVIMSCTTRRNASDICAEVLFEKCGDAKEECHNQHPADKSVDNYLEAAEKVKGAPLNDESENTAHVDTSYHSFTVDVKTNVFVESDHNSPMERKACTELQSESGNTDELPVIASKASPHTVAANSIVRTKEALVGVFNDHDGEGGKRIIVRETGPSQNRKNQEDMVGCADVTLDTDCKDEILDNKETFVQQFEISEVQICSSAAIFPEDLMSSTNGDKLVAVKGEGKDDSADVTLIAASSPTRGHSDADAKLKFDLNEGLNVDEGKHSEPVSEATDPCLNIYPASSLQNFVSSAPVGHPMSITVATATKGSFTPPNDSLRNKKELGWKGSAITSAFRPAEPRKATNLPFGPSVAPRPDGVTCKPGRPPLNIDLNLVDESSDQESNFKTDSVCELMTTASWRSFGGLDVDLNKVDESPDMSGILSPSVKALPSPIFSNGEASCKRDFDLNNGPAEEMPVEQTSYRPFVVSNISLQSAFRPRYNNYDSGNVYTCNPPGTSYSVSVSPSVPDREGFPFAGIGVGPHRVIVGPTSSLAFNSGAYRGSVSASSPAITLQSTLFQYPVFPFGTSNPIPTSVLAAGPSGFTDPSSTGQISAIPSQLVGNAGTVSFQYPHAYVVSRPHPDVRNIGVIDTNQKWGNQGLDLNSGPGVIDLKRRDGSMADISRQVSAISSQSFVEEQTRIYSMGGGILKRKEHDGGWNTDMLNFKQSSERR